MKMFHVFIVPVLLIFHQAALLVSSESYCADIFDRRQSFNLSINSKKNNTGKWVTTFVAKRDSENETNSIILDLKQMVTECRGRQIFVIQGTVSDTFLEGTVDGLTFYPKCGRNVVITNNGRTARKLFTDDRYNSVVFTNRPLRTNELFEVKVDSKSPKLGYFIGIGVSALSPKNIEIPSHINHLRSGTWVLYHNHSYNNGTQLTNSRSRHIDQLQVDERVGVMRSSSGTLHLFVNGADEGPVAPNIPESVYGVFEFYGDSAQVTITDSSSP